MITWKQLWKALKFWVTASDRDWQAAIKLADEIEMAEGYAKDNAQFIQDGVDLRVAKDQFNQAWPTIKRSKENRNG